MANHGTYIDASIAGSRLYKAFLPPPLPPQPELNLSPLYFSIDQATQALARLDGLSRLLPDIGLFLLLYVRKEAVLSSQIEGTQSSFSDLLLFEEEDEINVPFDDVRKVSNYVRAQEHGLKWIQDGRPLSLNLLKELHSTLLSTGRGSEKAPGEFRRTQNWISGTSPANATFVPPPPDHVLRCMSDLEKFLHDQAIQLPMLVKSALAHAQFETIHPFLDGNGRVGRLLITLHLLENKVLEQPLLYLSLYFKTYRSEYYERLMRVRTHGEWSQWIDFFLVGVTETAQQAAVAAQEILALFERDRKKIETLGRAASSALRVHEFLQRQPILLVPRAANSLALSAPTIRSALGNLSKLGVVNEFSGHRRKRTYVYSEYLKLLEQGTEPIARNEANLG